MHHVMAFASLYIGDSQTMAAEAGVLGVPFVRFNDFVGRIGYLRELEDTYHLGYGIHASPLPKPNSLPNSDSQLVPQLTNKSSINAQREQANPTSSPSRLVPQLTNSTSNNQLREQASGPDAMYEIVERLVAMDPAERRTTFQLRRQKMLSDKIDCAQFLTYFIEQYPKSVEEVRGADANFWKKFK